jgi:SNF2 family DNA or RNA helicase
MFEVGQRVRARDLVWHVLDARQYDGFTSVQLRSLSKPVVERTFIHPIDDLQVLPPPGITFDLALPTRWSLLLDAYRLSMSHRRRDLLSLGRTNLVIEPYQILPVMKVMAAPRQRHLLADDVGLGKTVQAGLVMAELIARGRGDRVLIVTPAALVRQWQEEMRDKFELDFEIFDSETIDTLTRQLPAAANPWRYRNRVLTSLDYAKQDRVWRVLKAASWDLVIIDEAHYVAESGSVTHPVRTDRSRFAAQLAELTDSLLLLTATPHNGYDHSFWSILSLLDPLRFPTPSHMTREGIEQLMMRRTKRGIRNRDGSPRFRDRKVDEIRMSLDAPEFEAEKRLYEALTRYTKQQWRRAKKESTAERLAVGFAMTVLRKRAASSLGALRQSLRNRLDSLSPEIMVPNVRRGLYASYQAGIPLSETQTERVEGQVLGVPAESGAEGVSRERQALERLVRLAEAASDENDHKAARLVHALNELTAPDPDRKVIVFTEYRDTLDYLETYLRERGFGDRLILMHGSMDRAEREANVVQFNRPGAAILLATDAASEGLNLQFNCHTVIHYELPWNPNRLEQRNGRVDRWGQTHDVEVYNMVLAGTIEDDILARLVTKIERIRLHLGSASDVLGIVSELDIEGAIMDADEGESAEMAGRELERHVDRELEKVEGAGSLLSISGSFAEPEWREVEQEIEETRRDLPNEKEVEGFAGVALREFGGQMQEQCPGIFRIDAPAGLLARGVEPHYAAATFRREVALADRSGEVTFIPVGHPLLQTLVSRIKVAAEEDGARWRMRAMVLPQADPAYLCVYLMRFIDGTGAIVEERLLPIFIGLDGSIQAGETARQLLDREPLRVDPPQDFRSRYEPYFDTAKQRAQEAAEESIEQQATALRRERAEMIDQLTEDLKRWSEGKRDWIVHRGQTGQLELGLFEGSNQWRERQLKLVDLKVQQREEELERMRILTASAPELIAMAAVMPGGQA